MDEVVEMSPEVAHSRLFQDKSPALAFFSLQRDEIKRLDFFSCPGRLSQELQTGLHRWVAVKTANVDALPQFSPAMTFQQAVHDHLQGNALQ